MTRLGFLYPPCGAEDELYKYSEMLGKGVRASTVGVRISGGDDEHAPEHLSRTGQIPNLEFSARILARLAPSAAIWTCTSGSFIDGRAHAEAQAEAISKATGAPAASTSLAFASALRHLEVTDVAVLASYPEATAKAFQRFLGEFGITVRAMHWLSIDSGPDASLLEIAEMVAAAGTIDLAGAGALLIPDTAIPAWDVIAPLERQFGVPVLTANQVSVWEAARIAGLRVSKPEMGALFQHAPTGAGDRTQERSVSGDAEVA
ncbi:maleate cis-trans isomerase family protein [Chelativorans sp. YIM 93263]|uniref:maleate cis-trans isomerase family protein n=1 Tax=Chelativorans sp. YIM 93263 TaxID=2906648 RepID=UPI00237A03E2|nr:hypothetical protein [Chelativorans sp. YIM 93263]